MPFTTGFTSSVTYLSLVQPAHPPRSCREQAECGSGFTSKLEGMFKDVELSHDVMASFRESSHASKISSDVELSVKVLTQARLFALRIMYMYIPHPYFIRSPRLTRSGSLPGLLVELLA